LDTRTDLYQQQFNKQILRLCLKEIPVRLPSRSASNAHAHQQLFHAWPARPDIIAAVQAQNRRQPEPDDSKTSHEARISNGLTSAATQDSPLIDRSPVTQNYLSGSLNNSAIGNGLNYRKYCPGPLRPHVGVSEITTDYGRAMKAKFSGSFL